MGIYAREPFTVRHHASNFGGFRHCGSGNKTFLICEVIPKDHTYKELCDSMVGSDFMGDSKSPLCYV